MFNLRVLSTMYVVKYKGFIVKFSIRSSDTKNALKLTKLYSEIPTGRC